MTLYRCLKDFPFHDAIGNVLPVTAGQLVNVLHRGEEKRLLAEGVIGLSEHTHSSPLSALGDIAGPYERTMRVVIFLHTSPHYSGGRIHIYQYAWCLADMGAEVWLATDGHPKWAEDYPSSPRMHVVNWKDGHLPRDTDLIITDSKTDLGEEAVRFKRRQPWAPLVCFNFETPNWVSKFCPEYATSLGDNGREIFKQADLVLSNSGESERWMGQWLDGYKRDHGFLPPAVNTFALEKSKLLPRPHERPYAVWSARSATYKGGNVAIEAVSKLNVPMDLIMFGQPNDVPRDSELHRFVTHRAKDDVSKFNYMRHARMVLAPSLFEGYGMVPGEALSVGTECVVYNLPVLRQEYGDVPGLHFAKWNDRADYCKVVAGLAFEHVHPVTPEVQGRVVSEHGMDAMREHIKTIRFHTVNHRKVSVELIAYWGFVPEALESVYRYADEILVAFGKDKCAQEIDDGSLSRLTSFPDPDKKIKMEVRKDWPNKLEMRDWCLRHSGGNYLLLLDGDEIWTGLDLWMAGGIDFGCPRWVNFWHNGGFWISDGGKACRRWGRPIEDMQGSVCPHYRCSYLRRSYRLRTHPVMESMGGHELHLLNDQAAVQYPETRIYHLGHALPEKVMRAKHEFYLQRDGRDPERERRGTSWLKWNGMEGDCGDGIVRPVTWELPEIVQRGLKTVASMSESVHA